MFNPASRRHVMLHFSPCSADGETHGWADLPATKQLVTRPSTNGLPLDCELRLLRDFIETITFEAAST